MFPNGRGKNLPLQGMNIEHWTRHIMCENPHVTKVVHFAKPKPYFGFGLDVDVCPAGQGLVLIILFVGSSLAVGLR